MTGKAKNVRLAETTSAAAVHLTPREAECLRLLAQGESSKRIAFLLEISSKTVQHHIAAAKMKLGGRNAVHTVAIALAKGILD